MSESPTPDTETFNIEDWMTTGTAGRASETVTIYKNTGLLDESRALQAEIRRFNEQDTGEPDPDAAMGDEDKAQELQRRQDELEAQIRAAKADVVITALSDSEVEDIADTFKQRHPGEKRQWDQTVKGTCLVLAQAATIGGRKLSADQWRKLADGPLAGGQWQLLKQTILLVQNKTPRADSPFSRPGSPRLTGHQGS